MVLEGEAKADVELCPWRYHYGARTKMEMSKWDHCGNAPCQHTGLAGSQGYQRAPSCSIETVEMKPSQGKILSLGSQLEPAALKQKVPVMARGSPAFDHLGKKISKVMVLSGWWAKVWQLPISHGYKPLYKYPGLVLGGLRAVISSHLHPFRHWHPTWMPWPSDGTEGLCVLECWESTRVE